MEDNTNNVVSLLGHKKKKQYTHIISELNAITQALSLAQEGLKHFKHFISVIEIISVMETNKVFLQIQKQKYEQQQNQLDNPPT